MRVVGIVCSALGGLLLPGLLIGLARNLGYVSYWIIGIVLSTGDLRRTPHWPLSMNYSLAAQLHRFFGAVTAFGHDGRFYNVSRITNRESPIRHRASTKLPPVYAVAEW